MRINTRLLLSGALMLTGFAAMAEIPAGFDTENKWWCDFTGENGEMVWPAGSTYGSAVVTKENGGRQLVWSKTDPDDFTGFFITPLLRATAGEEMTVEARSNSSYSTADGINIYISATREGLANEETRTLVYALAAEGVDEDHLLAPSVKEFTFSISSAGEYYVGFSLYNSGQIAGIYGLELIDKPHEWSLLPGNMPSSAIQNRDAKGSFKILNYGTQDEKAGSYTITTYVDGVPTQNVGTVDIKAEHLLDGEGVEVPFTFRSPRVGNVKVSAKVKAEDGYSISSEEMIVEVLKETLDSEKMVGSASSSFSKAIPFFDTYDNSETIALYTPQMLGLLPGDKIKSIYLNGYVLNSAYGRPIEGHVSNRIVCYAWTDDAELEKPNTPEGAYNYEDMKVIINEEDYVWHQMGTDSELVPLIKLDFENPIIYEEGKSLVLFFHLDRLQYSSGIYFEYSSANPKTSYRQYADNQGSGDARVPGRFTNNWAAVETPPIHLVLDVEPRKLSGRVAVGDEAAAKAVVTLVSTDGDNVQYEGEADDEGNYSIDVIQSERTYNVEAHTADFGEFDDEELDFSEASVVKNLDLRREVKIDDESAFTGGADNSIVHFSKKLNQGYNMVALPVALEAGEVTELFGESAKVYDYDADVETGGKITVNFNTHEGDLTAGRPYLIYTEDESKSAKWSSRATVSTMEAVKGSSLSVEVTTKPMEVTEGMVVIDESLIKDHNAISLAAATPTLPAYSGYLAVPAGKSVEVNLDNADLTVGVEVIEIGSEKAMEIYDLNGVRVANPDKGLYIINGRLILVK